VLSGEDQNWLELSEEVLVTPAMAAGAGTTANSRIVIPVFPYSRELEYIVKRLNYQLPA
jgi:hypothetical protein